MTFIYHLAELLEVIIIVIVGQFDTLANVEVMVNCLINLLTHSLTMTTIEHVGEQIEFESFDILMYLLSCLNENLEFF